MKPGLFAAAAVAALMPLAPAHAVTLLVTISGDDNASFEIDSNPVPDFADDFGFLFDAITAKSPAGSSLMVGFYVKRPDAFHGGGGLSVLGFDPGDPLVNAFGPELFTGPTSAPTIEPGTYALVDPDFGLSYTVTIAPAAAAAVPEPITWATMTLGFGLVGAAMRRRPAARAAYRFA